LVAGSDWGGKVVLIAGGAGGMGLAIAERFAQAGAALALADLDAKRLAVLAPPGALRFEADVAQVADCDRVVAETLARHARLDLLVNAAGIWVEGPSAEASEADWDRCLDSNLKGTFFCCRAALPALVASGGQIVNIASDAGLQGNAGAAIYCASKGGVVLLTKALALELAPEGVRVNALCPADVETPMLAFQAERYGAGDPAGYLDRLRQLYPQGARQRFIRPEEVAEAVFAIANLEPMTGAALPLDFGTTAGR
jgi:NAD(P)-dependent dehydrogenase (short-subunit alcohol dehydrogenase family)